MLLGSVNFRALWPGMWEMWPLRYSKVKKKQKQGPPRWRKRKAGMERESVWGNLCSGGVCVCVCVDERTLWPPPCVRIQLSVCTTGSGPAEIWGYTRGMWSCSAPRTGPSPPPVPRQHLKKTRPSLIRKAFLFCFLQVFLWWPVKWFIYSFTGRAFTARE